MIRILTITGTRPELIKLSLIIKKLDALKDVEHCLVYTNQNYDVNLRDIFIRDLGLRTPDYTFGEVDHKSFLASAFMQFDAVLDREKPDKVLVLGDTNSGLLAILANKRHIPVYHMEGGLRCWDNRVPEESNRRIIDTISTYNLPHTENSKENLLKEGYHKNNVFKIGNPIYEVLNAYMEKILGSDILCRLGIMPYTWDRGVANPYVLLTFHRADNVDDPQRSLNVANAVNRIAVDLPVIFSFHPRAKDQLTKHGIEFDSNVILCESLGFFEFEYLTRHAKCVISDSGTVPESCAIYHKPCVAIRAFTERQELLENGSLILSGTGTMDILRAYNTAISMNTEWQDLPDYFKTNVSDTVIKLLIGK
jgi:UDP-N-acetylglucosamine 2-epimerase (non-hydrolysing)